MQTAEWPNLVAGQLPKMMLVCLVSSAALSGSHDTTPFYLDHFDVSNLNAEIDGKLYPSGGYTMDFGTHQTLTCYDGLCRVMEVFNSADRALPFSRTEYEKGFTIFGLDFKPRGTPRGALTIIKQGNLNLNIRFQKQLPSAINIIAYLVFDSTISINNNRQAIFDFSA